MILQKFWDKVESHPAPKRPVQQMFLVTGFTFILGLIVGQFLPQSLAPDQIPVRIDLPFRLASSAAFCTYAGIGVLFLSPVARKYFLVFLTVFAALLSLGVAVLFYSLFLRSGIDFGAIMPFKRASSGMTSAGLAIVLIWASIGWVNWFKSVPRND